MMFNAIVSTLAMGLLATGVMASPITVNATLAARDPALKGGFLDHCYLAVVISEAGSEYGHLHARCSLNSHMSKYYEFGSSLDLSLCMGNYNNQLSWGYKGGAMSSCTNCATRWSDIQYIDCDCGSLDLNDGIYMAKNGALACYDQVATPYTVAAGLETIW